MPKIKVMENIVLYRDRCPRQLKLAGIFILLCQLTKVK